MKQGIVTIKDKQWSVLIPETYAEMSAGLGSIPSIEPYTGMFFVMPYDMTVSVTTEPMLFNIDIAFIDSSFRIVDIARNIEPGNIVTTNNIIRYFLEVNAGELDGIDIGDYVLLSGYTPPQNLISLIVQVVGVALFGVILAESIFGNSVMFADSPEKLAMSIYDIGYSEKISQVFSRAIERARKKYV